MPVIRISGIRSLQDFYRQFASQLNEPNAFGQNLDALYDALTGSISGPITLEWHDYPDAKAHLNEDELEALLETLQDAADERDDLRLHLGNSK